LSTKPYKPVSGNPDYGFYKKELMRYLSDEIDKVLPDNPDLIVFPEYCSRVDEFSYEQRKEYYKYLGTGISDCIGEKARKHGINIAYSAARYVPEDTRYPFRNSTIVFDRKGGIAGIYDKNHLVFAENEMTQMRYGTEANLIKLDFGTIACAICFDLNFDVLLNKYKEQRPDLIVFSSAYHGGIRQEQWAYQCRSFFAGAVRADESRILNPFGETVARTTNYTDYVTAGINLDSTLVHMDYNMEKILEAKNKYKDNLTVYDPGHVGSVLLSCESADLTVMDIIKEFEIELLDDYFARALSVRENVINNSL
jgi:apolipoprotein N-acyltransferase